ncbi:MAG: YqaJ viral recombinase family protein [Reyranella sp.]|uniref:YqaJ viral recombinase family nuclease n=1 Tax=Reyranella sp. TaxID=1929291 RepID=UPI003D0996A1
MPTLLYPADDTEWHKLRHKDVTSTEAAALFGLSPYSTAYELAVQKVECAPPTIADNERMFWGRMHERTIARVIGLRYGVKVRKLSAYARHSTSSMGASFDYEIVGLDLARPVEDDILQRLYTEHGAGILECKNVDAFVYSRQWASDTENEAPSHIEIQVQHQLEVIDREWTVIAALVGGNRLEKLIRLRDREVGAAIRKKIDGFWTDMAVGKMPPIELPEDADIIRKIYWYANPGKLLDARGNAEIKALCEQYKEAAARKKEAEDDQKSAVARILMAIGEAEKAITDGYNISATMVGDAEIPAFIRAGYRRVTVTPQKPKKEAKK